MRGLAQEAGQIALADDKVCVVPLIGNRAVVFLMFGVPMRRLVFSCLLTLLPATAVHAQEPRDCSEMRDWFNKSVDDYRNLEAALNAAWPRNQAPLFSTDQQAALIKAADATDVARKAVSEAIAASEDAQYEMTKCARMRNE